MSFAGRVAPPHEFGRLKIMRRTDGLWIVYDPSRPMGDRTIWTSEPGDADAEQHASDECRRLAELG